MSTVLQSCLLMALVSQVSEPIRLHPDNPHWFLWRGQTVALITSAEHYGAVLNLDFDYLRYLDTLQRDGMNYTRIFAGSYVEPQGAFGIRRNTLAPAPGRFLAPWTRSEQTGYAGGGNKFDLDRFNPHYLSRLKDFIAEARRRGIVVELTFFSSTYGEQQWAVHPLNPANHIQAIAVPDWKKLHTSDNGAVMVIQEKLVRWLVARTERARQLVLRDSKRALVGQPCHGRPDQSVSTRQANVSQPRSRLPRHRRSHGNGPLPRRSSTRKAACRTST